MPSSFSSMLKLFYFTYTFNKFVSIIFLYILFIKVSKNDGTILGNFSGENVFSQGSHHQNSTNHFLYIVTSSTASTFKIGITSITDSYTESMHEGM